VSILPHRPRPTGAFMTVEERQEHNRRVRRAQAINRFIPRAQRLTGIVWVEAGRRYAPDNSVPTCSWQLRFS
jgi:hypothetical protein